MKDNNELKKPEELDIDLENNTRMINNNITKYKPIGSDKEDKCTTDIIESTVDGFDYEKKYAKNETMHPTEEIEKLQTECEDIDDASGTKLNPNLEQFTKPDPDETKNVNHLLSINKKNKNQPL